ncbi:MAG: flagellar basal body L-ring protein FlgH [Bdellovibrionales bacterium]|nr:flagellar basal body L-ring protein FlgH [Bdellovibrionales bacterium]
MLKFNSRNSELLRVCVAIVAIAFAMGSAGCSSFGRSMKNMVSGEDKPKVTGPKYSDQDNLRFQADRKYRRMNKTRFEDEAEVSAQAGSLWVMEGQGGYLFAQNQTRMMGDLLNVKLEGAPKQQLQSKVRVISKLLERLDAPLRSAASTAQKPQGAAGQNAAPPSAAQGADAAAKPDAQGEGGAGAATAAGEKPVDSKTDPISGVQNVPTRIVEQLKDGSYRVRGIQPFMIGRREYKVIVTGVVRPEDFDDGGIDSTKLMDSQFDIVSSRKGASL